MKTIKLIADRFVVAAALSLAWMAEKFVRLHRWLNGKK